MSKRAVSEMLLLGAAALLIGSTTVARAEQTWSGRISDAICGASHAAMASQIGASDHDCLVQCVGSGSKYVFVTDDKKVLQIANQNFAGLKDNDENVTLTGELKGDAVTVTKIERRASK
jgi:hypothetical protein